MIKKVAKHIYSGKVPNTKKEKTQAIATLLFSLFGIAFLGYFAISPTLSTISQLRKELEDSILVDKKLDEKISNLAILQQKYAGIESDIPYVLSAIPQIPNVPTFIGQIQTLAQNSRVSIVKFQVFRVELTKVNESTPKPVGTADYSTFAFSLSAEGPYDTIARFLSDLTNFNRIISIDSITIGSKNGRAGEVQLNIDGKAFFKT